MPGFLENGPDFQAAPEGELDEIRRHLNVILGSAEFRRSDRSRALLEFVVNAVLRGERESIKESLIGVKVFNRPADYDPKTDPVVRVSAGRLRAKLEAYYQREGVREPVRITIPRGAYIPSFQHTAPVPVEVAIALPAPRTGKRRLAIGVGVVVVLATLAGGSWLSLRTRAPVLDRLRPFVLSGSPNNAVFSPAGDSLAFDAQEADDRHRNIYVQRLDAQSPARLTHDETLAHCPAWSPDGSQIAFLRDAVPNVSGIFLIGSAGGEEHKLMDLHVKSATLSWSPDGQWLAAIDQDLKGSRGVVLISVRSGETRVITNPPADWRGDSLPIFSPDSTQLAFRRTKPRSSEEDIYEVPKGGGAVRQLTFDGRGISGLAFLRDGSLLFSSRRAGSIRGLWWMAPDRSGLARLTPTTMDAGPPAVSSDGHHIAVVVYNLDVNIWRVSAEGTPRALPLVASEVEDSSPQYSPDGTRLAFCSMRSGTDGIWISSADGAHPTRLLDGNGAVIGSEHWSPDGSQLAFEWRPSDKAEIYAISSSGGQPRALLADGYDNGVPVWSRDGKWVYFNSTRTGRTEIWRIPAAGGKPVQITNQGAVAAEESSDGSALYFMGYQPGSESRSLWRVRLEEGKPVGQPERLLSDLRRSDWSGWAVGRNAIYYLHRQDDAVAVLCRDLASGRTRKIYDLEKAPAWGGGLALSPDERWLLFTQVDRDGSSIFVQ